jgi:hypothetical protein
VDLVGIKTVANFEVIEIIGEKYLYPSLLGIDWEYENYAIIDLKKEIMTFECDEINITQLLDPYRGPRYNDLVDESMEQDDMDQLYNITAGNRVDYIDPTVNGSISW